MDELKNYKQKSARNDVAQWTNATVEKNHLSFSSLLPVKLSTLSYLWLISLIPIPVLITTGSFTILRDRGRGAREKQCLAWPHVAQPLLVASAHQWLQASPSDPPDSLTVVSSVFLLSFPGFLEKLLLLSLRNSLVRSTSYFHIIT